MDHPGQSESYPSSFISTAITGETKKKVLTPLLDGIEEILDSVSSAVSSCQRERVVRHLLSQMVCLGTHTITGLLSTCGRQFRDWSADYRLYSRDRIDPEKLFAGVRKCVLDSHSGVVVIGVDDTRITKSGRKTFGVKYLRDPLGPPFHVNLIRAQRFVQSSMAWPGEDGSARMIPVDFQHAPLPVKLGRRATQRQKELYAGEVKKCRISQVGVDRIRHMRRFLDNSGNRKRQLWAVVDGGYTNGTVLKQLGQRTTLVGRIRSDAKLYHIPEPQDSALGRRRAYGRRAPTPEQLRTDDTRAWRQIEVFFGGKRRCLRVKSLKPVRWRTAGQKFDLQLVVIAPTPYRLRKGSRLLYRRPAFLICTDPEASLPDIVQRYLWRWDLEVNFRDEKTIMGVGQAQVRSASSVANVTATAVAAYAILLAASTKLIARSEWKGKLPRPKWQRKEGFRPTTIRLIQNLRYELWDKSINFSGLATKPRSHTKPEKCHIPIDSAAIYASSYS